jgi:hypothetical protein
MTRLESGMSFLQVKASMTMQEKLRQVKSAICINRREIAHTRLEAVAGADNPYSLIAVFGRGHLAIKAGGAVYVTRCAPVEVVPREHANCTEEVPVLFNGTQMFVDPISYVIKSAGSPVHCNDVAPPRYQLGGKWYCSYPEIRECHDPAMLPVEEVKIEDVKLTNLGLGKSIYTKGQLEEFSIFQDSQGTRRAYLAETAELAYGGHSQSGGWGLGLGAGAKSAMLDLIGLQFIPFYHVLGPFMFLFTFALLIWGAVRLVITIAVRMWIIVKYRGWGLWMFAALWGTLFQLVLSPFNWVDSSMRRMGERVGRIMTTEAAPSKPLNNENDLDKETEAIRNLAQRFGWWASDPKLEAEAKLIEKKADCIV